MAASPMPSQANDDILRLKAALDVALTTLNSGDASKPTAGTTLNKAAVPKDLPVPPQSTVGGLMGRSEEPTHRTELPSSQAAPREESGALGGSFTGNSDAEARVRELEQLMIKKGLEEVELNKRTLELESQVVSLKSQVKEYEVKLAEALPLLESLDKSRTEAREMRRKQQTLNEEVDDLRSRNHSLEKELAHSQAEAARHDTTRQELEKQLESEREESLWLSEVEARQMKEMEAKCEELQRQCADEELERAEWQVEQQKLRQQVRDLERQATLTAAQKDANMREYVAQLKAGHTAMENEVTALRKQLTAAQFSPRQALKASSALNMSAAR